MEVLGPAFQGEPELELVLHLELSLLEVLDDLDIEGGTVNAGGFHLSCEMFLVAEIIDEDPGVKAAE